jgi:ABC-type nitrate/sulfonate/bicarbonate transport system substrate-binding protein
VPTAQPTAQPTSQPTAQATDQPSPTPVGPLTKINMAYPSPSVSFLPITVALYQGYFKAEGLDVEMSQVRPAQAVQAMVSGDIDYVTFWGSTIRAAATGVPIKAVMVTTDKAQDVLMAVSSVKGADDLKGKIIGVESLGSLTDLQTRLSLKALKLDPDADVRIVAIGDENVRLQQMLSGQIQAGLLGPQGVILGQAQGLNRLIAVADVVTTPFTALSTSDRKIAEKKDEVKRMIRAILKGGAFLRANKSETVKIMVDFLKIDEATAAGTYDVVLGTYSNTGIVTDEVVVNDLNTARQTGADIPANTQPDQVRNFGPLREVLQDMGLS